ncbi:MAG: ferredoxin [Actinobacteria bacterium]|nr:ferredoxin [Actinomycetota bacterium]
MPWLTRGLRNGIVTTHYPRRKDGYGMYWRAAVQVCSSNSSAKSNLDGIVGVAADKFALERLCPTEAISVDGVGIFLDRGKCILCGACVAARPDLFAFEADIELAVLDRRMLIVPRSEEEEDDLDRIKEELRNRTVALRRSVHIRHVDVGSDGSDEWEISALTNPVYDIARLGIFFTASPRHADILLVTGVGTPGMTESLQVTLEAMPKPTVVMAVGSDAVSGGIVQPGRGVGQLLDVDIWIPGSPASPFSILHGICLAVGMLKGDR